MTGRTLAALALVAALGGCGGSGGSDVPTAGAARASHRAPTPSSHSRTTPRGAAGARARPGSARAALEALPVKGRAPKTGYSRQRFGDGWLAVGGCDTRDRMLRRDLSRTTLRDACTVTSGHLKDPYTASAITFVRGGASEVDIDHVVALGDAWQKGAQQWTPARRVALANDPLNLLSVQSSANRQKGDGDAATWLPPNKAFRCRYVARQIAVKRKYGAWVTRAEHDAMARVLATCPGQRLPRSGRLRAPVVAQAPPVPERQGRTFANCDAVRAAGLAPLHRGTPGYRANPNLDRDHDGLACE